MKSSRTNNNHGQEYLVMFKVYVQADGGLLVVMGNTTLELSPDEVYALLCGTLDFAKVFAALHSQIDASTLDILSKNERVNGNIGG